MDYSLINIIAILIAIGTVFVIARSVVIINQQECMIVERLGKLHTVFHSGLNILIPFIDKARPVLWIRNGSMNYFDRLDLREVFIDIHEQQMITRDNVGIMVDAIIYLQITDVRRSVYEIQSLPIAVSQLTQTSLRSLVGELDLDSTLSGRDVINSRLKLVLDAATDKWGLKVNRVEIRNIVPPPEVQAAMEKQMQAERERRAKVLAAEGAKQSLVLNAEGEKKSLIERSEGEMQQKINKALGDKQAFIEQAIGQAKAIEQIAEAQAQSILYIKNAFGSAEVASNYLITMEYLKQYGQMTQKPGDKVLIPYEATAALGAFSAVKEMMTKFDMSALDSSKKRS
jgi:regulator of protease activity HflC (stomatin/prohibitin superfamily)